VSPVKQNQIQLNGTQIEERTTVDRRRAESCRLRASLNILRDEYRTGDAERKRDEWTRMAKIENLQS
jgi:hypothetical protein